MLYMLWGFAEYASNFISQPKFQSDLYKFSFISASQFIQVSLHDIVSFYGIKGERPYKKAVIVASFVHMYSMSVC